MFALTYPSSDGRPAYLVDPAALGIRDRLVIEPWARTTFKASAFPTAEAALQARDDLVWAQRFVAPEYNWGLLNRLAQGEAISLKKLPPQVQVVRGV